MCGLVGIAQSSSAFPEAERLNAALVSLIHRGPDAQAIYWRPNDGVALGHSRLSIIDLDVRSDQPFETERCVLIFNGEIYNFRVLRQELEALGAVFRTKGDTEVIAIGYAVWGKDVFRRLKGMFAIALFDRRENQVHLARDLFGIKPLYVAPLAASGFVFSSEIKGILALRDLTLSLDTFIDTSLWGFPLSHASIYRDVTQVMPGSVLTLSRVGDRWSAHAWVSKSTVDVYSTAQREAPISVEHALTMAVDDHLIADVPVATALSGGIDSSIVTALAARRKPDLVAFTATYAERDDPEVEHARLLCRAYGLRHEVVSLRGARLEPVLRTVCAHLEEPIANINAILSYGLAQAIHQAGFKVVLIGEGSDEVFAGYPWHRFAREAGVDVDPGKIFDAYMSRRASGRVREWLRMPTVAALDRRIAEQRDDFISGFEAGSDSPLNRFLRYDQLYQMQFSQLHRVDRMFMAHSVEARVPFLYEPVLSASATLPDAAKISLHQATTGERAEKIILGEAAAHLLPREILQRRKFGPGGTVNLWHTPLMEDLPNLFDEALTAGRFAASRKALANWIDWSRVRQGQLDPKAKFHLLLMLFCADIFLVNGIA